MTEGCLQSFMGPHPVCPCFSPVTPSLGPQFHVPSLGVYAQIHAPLHL